MPVFETAFLKVCCVLAMTKPYCLAQVAEIIRTPNECDIEFVTTELSDADAVIHLLQQTYDRFAVQLADANAQESDEDRSDLSRIGGFGVQLTNRFGGEVEVGLGRKYCVLIRYKPGPTEFCCGSIRQDGTLVFFLDGWHYTELNMSDLISRDDCLVTLRHWLESGAFPSKK